MLRKFFWRFEYSLHNYELGSKINKSAGRGDTEYCKFLPQIFRAKKLIANQLTGEFEFIVNSHLWIYHSSFNAPQFTKKFKNSI